MREEQPEDTFYESKPKDKVGPVEKLENTIRTSYTHAYDAIQKFDKSFVFFKSSKIKAISNFFDALEINKCLAEKLSFKADREQVMETLDSYAVSMTKLIEGYKNNYPVFLKAVFKYDFYLLRQVEKHKDKLYN